MLPKRTTARPRVPCICRGCGSTFLAKPSDIDAGRGHFCTRACFKVFVQERSRRTLLDRFREKVEKTDGCWRWIGPTTRAGYGTISASVDGKTHIYAHRLAWEITNGPIPSGLFVCHRCDVPTCVNPAHLFVGSAADNNADMHAKGRAYLGQRSRFRLNPEGTTRGEMNPRARLTAAQVSAIRRRYAHGGVTHRGLAAEYGVRQRTIYDIVHRRSWTHLED